MDGWGVASGTRRQELPSLGDHLVSELVGKGIEESEMTQVDRPGARRSQG